MKPRSSAPSSLAAWLHSYNPQHPLEAFQRTLQADQALAAALSRLLQAVGHTSTGDNDGAHAKISTLRTSLTHLTAHLSSLTDRLSASQSALAALQLAHDRTARARQEETRALKALVGVWEGRWREERRAREEVEERVRREEAEAGGRKGGRNLNGAVERRETELRMRIDKTNPPRPPRSRRHFSSSSSAASSPSHPRTPPRAHLSKPNGARLSKKPRTSKRALLAHLASELERERREQGRVLAEKDDEIVRLNADQEARRAEAQRLYDSLDTLLSLGGTSFAAQNVPLPPVGADEAEQHTSASPRRASFLFPPSFPSASAAKDRTTHAHTRALSTTASIFDHPSLVSAAKHSRSRARVVGQGRAGEEEEGGEGGETRRLEEEVRGLEWEIARLNTANTPQAHPPAGLNALSPTDRADFLATISDLTAQIERLKRDLGEVKNERAALRRVCEQYRNDREPRTPVPPDEAAAERIAELEAECARLSHLLTLSESESAHLSSQLASTHSSIESLSARVRRKLEEQRAKLDDAYEEIERLVDECRGWEERYAALEGEVRGLIGEEE